MRREHYIIRNVMTLILRGSYCGSQIKEAGKAGHVARKGEGKN
jgi:hypothetical protein